MNAKQGRRRLERIEVKGDPYEFISRFPMSLAQDQILRFLYDMRIAKVTQIQAHLKLSQRWTQQLLSELYRNGFVFRKFAMVDKGSSEGIYFLDSMGAYYLANSYEMTRRDFPWSHKDNAVAPEKTNHTLSITAIRLAVECSCNIRSGIKLIKFWGERRSGRRSFSVHKEQLEISMDAEIDLLLEIEGSKYLETVFIEYDSGFEDIRQIREKIKRYDQYYASKEFSDQYQTIPSILIVCENEISMRRFTRAIQDSSSEKSKYWIGLMEDVLEDPFAAPVKTAEGISRNGIIDLT